MYFHFILGFECLGKKLKVKVYILGGGVTVAIKSCLEVGRKRSSLKELENKVVVVCFDIFYPVK